MKFFFVFKHFVFRTVRYFNIYKANKQENFNGRLSEGQTISYLGLEVADEVEKEEPGRQTLAHHHLQGQGVQVISVQVYSTLVSSIAIHEKKYVVQY